MLRISDTTDGVIVAPTAVLATLAPEARRFQWSVLDLREMVPREGHEADVESAEQRVIASPHGWLLTFDELETFAGQVRQVIDAVFIACESAESVPRRSDDDATIVERAEIVVAAVDSSFWLVSAGDEVLARIAARFREVGQVEVGAVALSTWGRDY